MPFRLKNVGATYQRAMVYIFHDLIGNVIAIYLDDMLILSRKRYEHLHDLRTVFKRYKRYRLCLNPSKCVFVVTLGKMLGNIIF